jgi:alpha-tubulin suppressor-like RCC1 family protein
MMSKIAGFLVLLCGLLFSAVSSRPAEAACGGSPVIVTDKRDYGPTDTVQISGIGFNCGEVLSVLVTAPDGSTKSGGGTGAAGPDSVVADDNGAFLLSYQLSGASEDGTAYRGQVGIYQVEARDSSTTILAETTFSDGAGEFSCALTAAGGVKCWGPGDSGKLGNGGVLSSATPVDVIGLTSGVIQVTVGSEHACALTTAGGVKCWGSSAWGQLGNGTRPSIGCSDAPSCFSATPVDVTGLTSSVVQISAGGFHTCAVTTAGGAKCWGDNFYGQMGNGTFSSSPSASTPTPVDVTGLTSAVAHISAGGLHTCAVTTAGGAKCWGRSTVGQVGNGTFTCNFRGCGLLTPVDVSTLTSGVAQISSGGNHTCALTIEGGVKCWGNFLNGQLGDGTCTIVGQCGIATAVDVIGLSTGVAQVRAGGDHTCALTVAGGVKCWGASDFGQLGNGTFIYGEREDDSFIIKSPFGSATPTDVTGLASGVAQISVGMTHTCALTTTGAAKCWGDNRFGQLGNGTFTTLFPFGIPTPGDVSGLSGVAALWDNEPLVPWTFSGFFAPVEMGGVVNSVKGGSTVAIKFQVFAGATELTDPSIVVQPLTAAHTLCSGGPTDEIEVAATGGTSLRYDTESGVFLYNWRTPKMPGSCYTITVTLTNGTSLNANFELR